MTVAAASRAEAAQVVLWHPHHGGYLHKSGDGFTRRISRAARFSLGEALAVKSGAANRLLEIEPVDEGAPAVSRPRRAPRRSDLSSVTQEELLRRALLALRPRGGTQEPRWFVVMEALALTSVGAIKLCRRLQLDQNERTDR